MNEEARKNKVHPTDAEGVDKMVAKMMKSEGKGTVTSPGDCV